MCLSQCQIFLTRNKRKICIKIIQNIDCIGTTYHTKLILIFLCPKMGIILNRQWVIFQTLNTCDVLSTGDNVYHKNYSYHGLCKIQTTPGAGPIFNLGWNFSNLYRSLLVQHPLRNISVNNNWPKYLWDIVLINW